MVKEWSDNRNETQSNFSKANKITIISEVWNMLFVKTMRKAGLKITIQVNEWKAKIYNNSQ